MTPLLSIVTGTVNRLPSLQRMIASARHEIPRGLAHELVVVDGGSTDGTQSWCKAQPDIRLIEHGELRGAIRAFCDGAQAARGDFVIMANDDITFKPLSIIAALAHLERTPTCGAVAFADNRTSLVKGDGSEYRVEGMGATLPDGTKTMVTYAQVGMFRRSLGNAAGWWGADDPVMGQARTYGGDNYLSSRIWEMGHTVDAVPQAMIEDHIFRDGLRTVNAERGPNDSKIYYTRFPTVQLPAELVAVSPNDRLRILHLPVYEWNHAQAKNKEAGLTESLAAYGLAFEWDYLNAPVDLVELVRAWQPDLLITQIQGIGRITPYMLATMHNAVPGMVIVNWCGDIYERGLTSDGVIDLLRYVDLQLTVNAKVLADYEHIGIRAAYWQIYFKEALKPLPVVPAYEILFQGNCYGANRDALVRALREVRLPNARHPRLGLYGNCRGANGNTHYDFSAQAALYSTATITIGDTHPGGKAFVSNRLFQCLGNGGFLLQQHSEGLEEYTGLVPGKHYIEWSDLRDLKQKVVEWLAPEKEHDRKVIAQAGMEFVRQNYSADAQVGKLFELLSLIQTEKVMA